MCQIRSVVGVFWCRRQLRQRQPARSGTWKAWLDGYGSTHTDTLSQSVSVPAGCDATLSFYLHVTSEETTSSGYDRMTVRVGSTTLDRFTNLDKAAATTLLLLRRVELRRRDRDGHLHAARGLRSRDVVRHRRHGTQPELTARSMSGSAARRWCAADSDIAIPRRYPSVRRSWPGDRGVRPALFQANVEEGPGSTGQGGGQHPPGATRGKVPQRTDRRHGLRFGPVRVKRWCKRPPATGATRPARQTPPGARSRSREPRQRCQGNRRAYVRGRPARVRG